MGSSGFLLIFAAVNLAAARLHSRCGANPAASAGAAAACLVALAALIWQRAVTHPVELWALAGMIAASFLAESTYRLATGRELHSHIPRAPSQ